MKSHSPTTHRNRRKRRAADEEPRQIGARESEEAHSPAHSLDTLRDPQASRAARGAAALGLQPVLGNAAVARELGALQRYAVGAAANASCGEVIQWIDGNSPYTPEWAHTHVQFKWGGSFKITGNAKTGYKLSVAKASVTMTKSVDMPEWQPSGKAMKSAWQQAYGTLRAHEARHEAIGAKWKVELLKRLKALSLDITDKDQDSSISAGMVQAEWDQWVAEQQQEQDSIDPYQATLNCPVAQAEAPSGDSDAGAGGDADSAAV
jgi:hypothetical protein